VPDPTPQLVLQRIRNRIIETLETLASFDEQRAYAKRVPICYVPYELINSWEDSVDSPRPAHLAEPVFSTGERDAIEQFYPQWRDAADLLPKDYPPLEDVLAAPYWLRLRDAARRALAVLLVRGRLPEDAQAYLDPTQEQGRDFFSRSIAGSVVMLNLLRFRAVADYTSTPSLMPDAPISGEEAYRLYMEHTLPYLQTSGGELLFYGRGGNFLIGPATERWDAAMLVRQSSIASFLAFASNQDYLAGIGHRTAALEDSRLLPLFDKQV
jgi:hypothetical protein